MFMTICKVYCNLNYHFPFFSMPLARTSCRKNKERAGCKVPRPLGCKNSSLIPVSTVQLTFIDDIFVVVHVAIFLSNTPEALYLINPFGAYMWISPRCLSFRVAKSIATTAPAPHPWRRWKSITDYSSDLRTRTSY